MPKKCKPLLQPYCSQENLVHTWLDYGGSKVIPFTSLVFTMYSRYFSFILPGFHVEKFQGGRSLACATHINIHNVNSLTHMTTMDSFVVRGNAKFQGSLQAKQLNLKIVPVMVDSTTSCPKELMKDPKTSTGFKDCTGVFKGLMGEDREIHEVIRSTSTGQFLVLHPGW